MRGRAAGGRAGWSKRAFAQRLTFRHQGRDERLTDVAGQVIAKALV